MQEELLLLSDDEVPSLHVLPEQIINPPRLDTPARNLAWAVLTTALTDLGLQYHSRRSLREWAQDASVWLNSDELSYPFSFVNICAYFDLEHKKIRNYAMARVQANNPHKKMRHRMRKNTSIQ